MGLSFRLMSPRASQPVAALKHAGRPVHLDARRRLSPGVTARGRIEAMTRLNSRCSTIGSPRASQPVAALKRVAHAPARQTPSLSTGVTARGRIEAEQA